MPMGRMAKLDRRRAHDADAQLEAARKKAVDQDRRRKDGRVRFVSITAKGRAVAKAALPPWRRAQSRVGPKMKEMRLSNCWPARLEFF